MVALAIGTTVQAGAHPPDGPDHGINESTFWTLWAGDTDSTNLSEPNTTASFKLLTDGTDVPLDRPPRAVETWNTGEHDDVPTTGTDSATHPQGATLSDGTYLKDVGISMLAVQPSTRVHLSDQERPLYVRPEGDVLGMLDYRVAVPETKSTDSGEIQWALRSHEVESVQLLRDGEVLNETNGTKTPTLSYSDLRASTDQRDLTLNATVSVTLRRTVVTETDACSETLPNETGENSTTEPCETTRTSTQERESVTVSDAMGVRVYSLLVSGFTAEYPDGDLGLVTYRSYPWYGLSHPDGEVRGVWRFYSARNPSWDQFSNYRSDDVRTTHSPAHPLQVHAYPIATGPTPWPRATTSLLDVYGETYEAPSLPEAVALDSVEGTYTGSFGIGTRVETTNHDLSQIRATGLVRGSKLSLDPEKFSSVSLTESNLTLAITNRTAETITVQARLEALETGVPIETSNRDGHLIVAGDSVETNERGLVSVTVPRSEDAVSARYVPGDWWRNIPGYTGDTAVVHTGGTVLQYVDALFHGFVPIGALLFAGYLISRLTSWNFWPPWRGL